MISFKIITLFPDFFSSPLGSGLFGKAVEKGLLKVELVDLRQYSEDRLRRCDDYPYGGGSGMVLKPEPIFRALEQVTTGRTHVIYATPSGRLLDQALVRELVGKEELCILCGHYEGIDQRVIDRCVDSEISVGDYVLSGGEYAALVIMDAVARYVPGFMSNSESLSEESFEDYLLEYPQYTRPQECAGMAVPEVLLSGNHREIREWRLRRRIEKTKAVRPDLYKEYLEKVQKE